MPPKTGTGKVSKKRAKQILFRYARGWLVRHFYTKIRNEAHRVKTTPRDLLVNYKKHLREIMTRHDEDFSKIGFHFRELYDYLVKKKRYESAFEGLAEDGLLMMYDQIPGYFDSLGLKPSLAEIRFAAEKVLGDKKSEYKTFEYSKTDVLDISLHIYVPQGTGLKSKRVSTWMCPVIDNDNALRYDLSGKDAKKIQLSRCIEVVSTAIKDYRFGEEVVLSESQEMLKQIREGVVTAPAGSSRGKKAKKGKKKKH